MRFSRFFFLYKKILEKGECMSLYFGNRQVALNLGDAIRDTILPEPTAANAGRIVKVGEEGGYILSTDALPSQTDNSGKFLTTNGTIASWITIPTPDLSGYMQKGIDYVTAGKKSGTTLGINATAEGMGTTASGQFAHAEGNGTVSSARSAHAEGTQTSASGLGAHAEGIGTTASGDYSHVEGWYTAARYRSQHTFGEYNVFDIVNGTLSSNRGTYVEIVGNGTAADARSNARTLDWSGNETLAGKLTVGAGPTNNMDVATKQYVDTAIGTVDALPSQTSNSGKFLMTDGTVASWASVDALPSQSGQNGKFLTTNGTTASWANITIPTYTLSMSGNRITLTPSSGTTSYIDLPVYNGAAVV